MTVMVKISKKQKRYVLAVVPGDRRIDMNALKANHLGTYVGFAQPWQHGSNENTNGLLREWFPRSTDFYLLDHQVIAAASSLVGRDVPTRQGAYAWYRDGEAMSPGVRSAPMARADGSGRTISGRASTCRTPRFAATYASTWESIPRTRRLSVD